MTAKQSELKAGRASGAGTPRTEAGLEAIRPPTTRPSLLMSRLGEGRACHSSFHLRENTGGTKS